MRKSIVLMLFLLILVMIISFATGYTIIQYNSLEGFREGLWRPNSEETIDAFRVEALSYKDLSKNVKKHIKQEEFSCWSEWLDVWESFKTIPKRNTLLLLTYKESSGGINITENITGFTEIQYRYHILSGWKVDYIDIDFAGEGQ